MTDATLSDKRRQILEFIAESVKERGFPPSVREIGKAVGLTSSSTVHTHLNILQREGYLQRDPTKPRAIVVKFEPGSGGQFRVRPAAHVPLVGDVAAGTGVLAQERTRGYSTGTSSSRASSRTPSRATSSLPASPARRRR
jgi:repressor LexA